MRLTVCVNRTPVAGDIDAFRDKRDIDVSGCGLANTVAQALKDKNFVIWLNITTPYMPITSGNCVCALSHCDLKKQLLYQNWIHT